MRFGQSSGKHGSGVPRHWLVPMRMGLLMLLLVVVLVLMQQVRRPSMWRWLFAPGEQAAPQQQIDTRLARQAPPPPRREPVIQMAQANPNPPAAPNGEFFPGVRPELLAKVRDNTIWRGGEHDAFFHLLEILQQASEEELWTQAQRGVSFVQLFRQPEVYRGRLVHLRGRVRRVVWENAPQNQYGIRRYASLVFQMEDHPMDPTLVYALELPPGFPTGMEVNEPAELVGFFYKRKAYLAQDTLRTAPLVLARSLRWHPAQPAAQTEESPWQILLWSAVAAAVVALVVVLVAWKSQPPGARPRVELTPEEQRQVEQELERLAQHAEPPADSPLPPPDDSP